MGCDHPSCVPVGPLVGEIWHFEYFPTWPPSAILNFKNFEILLRDCRSGPNVLLCTKFYQNWFTQPNRGGHVGDMMGCDDPSWVSVGPLVG